MNVLTEQLSYSIKNMQMNASIISISEVQYNLKLMAKFTEIDPWSIKNKKC